MIGCFSVFIELMPVHESAVTSVIDIDLNFSLYPVRRVTICCLNFTLSRISWIDLILHAIALFFKLYTSFHHLTAYNRNHRIDNRNISFI